MLHVLAFKVKYKHNSFQIVTFSKVKRQEKKKLAVCLGFYVFADCVSPWQWIPDQGESRDLWEHIPAKR